LFLGNQLLLRAKRVICNLHTSLELSSRLIQHPKISIFQSNDNMVLTSLADRGLYSYMASEHS
jgi:hypothetical protein